MYPDLAYNPTPKAGSSKAGAAAAAAGAKNPSTVGGVAKSAQGKNAGQGKSHTKGKKTAPSSAVAKSKSSASASTTQRQPRIIRKQPSRPPQPPKIPHIDDRLPLHSPVVAAGVAVSAVRRDVVAEREAKKNGGAGAGAGAGMQAITGGEEGKEAKAPKMKRIVVRGKR